MRLRSDTVTSRMPVAWAASNMTPTGMSTNVDARVRTRMDTPPSSRGCEAIEACLEAMFLNDCGDAFVVGRRVRVEPVRAWVDVQREHLRNIGAFEKELSSGHQSGQQVELEIVQPKQIRVARPVEGRICEQ